MTGRVAWLAAALALVCLLAPTAWAETSPLAGSVPVSIDIPKIGTHADIVALGQEPNGNMAAPDDPDTVGWFAPGMGVGTPGNAFLDGHVDWGGRLRVFGLLKDLVPGDTLSVTDVDGNTLTYSVEWVRLYDTDSAPASEVFRQTTDEELTLITCGGAFDRANHMYLSRWVVRAIRSS
jgi:sortase (surface protein transpeptidase)